MDAGHIELAQETEFSLGGLLARPATCRVIRIRDGATEQLEPRVMQVLVALTRADGATVSREHLTHCCWNGRIVSEDAINRVIGQLRRLANGIAENGFRIETITKVGYRLLRIAPSVEPQAAPAPPQPSPGSSQRWHGRPPLLIALVGGAVVAGGLGLFLPGRSLAPSVTMSGKPTPTYHTRDAHRLPANAATAALYLRAREDWALRKPESINKAIDEFGSVISHDPGFAPAYAGLADAYLLAREFGAVDDRFAFTKAETAATVALRIDPDLASAQRALGFVRYWWRHDPVAAGQAFHRSLALATEDAQTHYWYGNILADNGEFASAMRELDAARAINPESIAIQADRAWALWSAGDRQPAIATLVASERAHPDFATPHDCLRTIYLADRNYPGYLAEDAAFTKLRGAATPIARAAAERAAFRHGGARELGGMLIRHALEERPEWAQDPAWPAYVASSVGDGRSLTLLLKKADRRGEIWGSAGEVARIRARWGDRTEVAALIARRRALRIG